MPASRRTGAFTLSGWKGEGEGGASVGIRRRPDSAAVTLYYRPGDEKAQTHSFALGRDKWLEQPVGDGRVKTRAAIGYAYGDPSGLLGGGLDFYAALVRFRI